jgi:L-rhamnose mutarotase
MKITEYSDVNEILEILLTGIKTILGEKLVGLYLDGSLVIGDFEPGISDIDLVAALSTEIDDQEFEALKKMHYELVSVHTKWYDRIEVCYITVDALKTVRTKTSQIVNISPGEPIHRKESNKEWLMNWYLSREKSKTLYGPSPKRIIEPISKEEFIQTVKTHTRSWDKYVQDMRNPYAQSYSIFAMCRALYTVKNGEQVSKKKAALWVEKEYPEWSEIIQDALKWRQGGKYNPNDDISHPKTVQFVLFVRKLILDE